MTVSAEPNNTNTTIESSPARKKVARTVKVPLKGADEEASGSPVKRKATPAKTSVVSLAPAGADVGAQSEASVVPVSRKRRGTPMRRRSARVAKAAALEAESDGAKDAEPEAEVIKATKENTDDTVNHSTAALATGSNARKVTPARGRGSQPTQRTRRLTQAREELDLALKDAVGPSSARQAPKKHAERSHDATQRYPAEDEDAVEGAADPSQQYDRQGSSVHSDGSDDSQNEHENEDEEADGDGAHDEDFDFTMVSVETLQSMRQGQNSSLLLDNSGIDVHTTLPQSNEARRKRVSVSYMPSSPPSFASQSRDRAANEVDAEGEGVERIDTLYPDLETQRHDPAAANALHHTAGSEQGQQEQNEDEDANENEDEDIWAEEASRSLNDSDQHSSEHEHSALHPSNQEQRTVQSQSHSQSQQPYSSTRTSNPPRLTDLFGSEPQPPPRSKIPRTWRRSSGIEFSYANSPAPPEVGALRKISATSTEEERADGVLTPPSTDDEAGVGRGAHGIGEEEGDSSMSVSADASSALQAELEGEPDASDLDFTHPDGVGTQLEHSAFPNMQDGRASAVRKLKSAIQADRNIDGNSLDADTNVDADADADADGPDTGLFWQTNLPNIYRTRQAQRPRFTRPKRAMDLSELLALEGSSPAKKPAVENAGEEGPVVQVRRVTEQAVRPAVLLQPISAKETVLASPLRRSLLKSSKIGGGGLPSVDRASQKTPQAHERRYGVEDRALDASADESGIVESFGSKASDQQQLLAEMNAATTEPSYCSPASHYAHSGADEDSMVDTSESGQEEGDSGEYENEELTTRLDNSQAMRSYEEHLNIESPQKIRVKFGDSTLTTARDSSVLEAKRDYPPLFAHSISHKTTRISDAAASDPTPRQRQPREPPEPIPQQPSLLNRLTSTFWTTLTRPTGPSSINPTPTLTPTEPEPIYSPLLRHEIRARYGVVPNCHPWTMTHMRTLHRLLNSCTSGRYDSIVPKSGPLPSQLKPLINHKITSITPSWAFTFTAQHGQVVEAFMQTLVEPHITDAIKDGSIEFVGDRAAWVHRGWFGDRHGDFVVFEHEEGVVEPKDGELIEREWVARAVGNCIWGDWLAQKDERERGMDVDRRKREIEMRRREWERRNGLIHDDDDEDE